MADQVEGAEPKKAASASVALAPRWAIIGIFLLLSVQAVSISRNFLMPVVLALLLTLIFSPVRRALSRAGIPAGVSAACITALLLAGFLSMTLALTAPIRGWIEEAPQIAQDIDDKLRDLRGAADGVRRAAQQVERLTSSATPVEEEAAPQDQKGGDAIRKSVNDTEEAPPVQRVVVEEPSQATAMVLAAPAYVGQILFTLVLMFFLLASGDMFYEKIVYVTPRFRDKKRAIRIAYEIERRLSRYLATIAAINFCLGASVGLVAWLTGMPNPLLFAAIGFLFNFVPYLGAMAGVALTFAVGVVSFETLQMAAVPALCYLLLTSIEGQIITPYFVGRSLRLNTVVVFLAVTFWAWLWSIVGMLVALPLLVALRTFSEHVPALQAFGHFLSSREDPTPRPEEQADAGATTQATR